jgi:hypothetical protein
MAVTSISSQGVKFIKIPRIDASGNDNTLSLQELTDLRISTSDQGVIQYNVLSISEYNDYYLYQVATSNITSSADNYIKDYRLAAYTTGAAMDSTFQRLEYAISPTGSNPLNYFDTSSATSGKYVFGNTPNIKNLSFTASFTVFNNSGTTRTLSASFYLNDFEIKVGDKNTLSNGSTNTYKVSSSLSDALSFLGRDYIIENDILEPILTTDNKNNVYYTGSFVINQATTPNKNNTVNYGTTVNFISTTYTLSPDETILTGSIYSVGSGNSSSLFNVSTGFFLIPNTNDTTKHNIELKINNNGAGAAGDVAVYLKRINVLGSSSVISSVNKAIPKGNTETYSFTDITPSVQTGDRIYLSIIADFSYSNMIVGSGNNSTWAISNNTVAASNNTTSDVSVLEPYLIGNFTNSDCDVTMNNATIEDYNQFYMDVDYGNNASSPINFSQIIAGTAVRATVKNHNYTYQRVTKPRYEGSKLQALKLNVYTSASTITQKNADIDNIELYSGDTSFGKEPVINLQKTYAARFQYIAGYSPDRYNTLFAYITDIVDEDGNIAQVRIDDPSYYNLINSFTDNEKCNIKFISSQNSIAFSGVNGLKNIIKGGKRIEPIIYTSSGSGNTGSFDQIAFLDNPNSPNTSSTDFTFKTGKTGSSIHTVPTSPTTIDSYNNLLKSSSKWSNSTGLYTFQTTDTKASPFRFNLNIDISHPNNNMPTDFVKIILQKSASYTGGNWVDVQTFRIQTLREQTISNQLQTGFPTNINPGGYLIPSASDVYRFQIDRSSIGTGNYYYTINSLELQQQYLSGSGLVFSSENYFITNSANLGIITASLSMSAFYNYYQQGVVSSGFNPITNPFKIEVGDEIRFENDESKTYFIYRVDEPGSQQDGRLKLYIQPPLQQNVNANSVLIRRYVKDPNYILFEGVKASGGTPGGLIHPEFITEKMRVTLESNKLFTLNAGSSNTTNQ